MKIKNLETNEIYANRKVAAFELGISQYKLDKLVKQGEKFESLKAKKEVVNSSSEDREEHVIQPA